MKTRFLFPARAKYWGLALLFIGLAFYATTLYIGSLPGKNLELFVWHNFRHSTTLDLNNDECFDNEIQLSLILVGLILIASSKEKIEDEHISTLRLESLQWAMYVNYGVFFVLIYTIYGLAFFSYSFYNVLTLLIFFIIRFRWKIYSLNRSLKIDMA